MPNGAVITYRDWTRRWGCRAPNPAWRRQPMKTKYFIQPGSYRVRPPAWAHSRTRHAEGSPAIPVGPHSRER